MKRKHNYISKVTPFPISVTGYDLGQINEILSQPEYAQEMHRPVKELEFEVANFSLKFICNATGIGKNLQKFQSNPTEKMLHHACLDGRCLMTKLLSQMTSLKPIVIGAFVGQGYSKVLDYKNYEIPTRNRREPFNKMYDELLVELRKQPWLDRFSARFHEMNEAERHLFLKIGSLPAVIL